MPMSDTSNQQIDSPSSASTNSQENQSINAINRRSQRRRIVRSSQQSKNPWYSLSNSISNRMFKRICEVAHWQQQF